MKKITQLLLVLLLLGPNLAGQNIDTTELNLVEQESRYEKEKAEYLQTYVLDKILGRGKAVAIVDVTLGIETTTTKQAAQEQKTERKRRLAEMDYILPGVPNPKSVTQETAPGESRAETGGTSQVKVETKTVIKRQMVTILHDEKVSEEKLAAVKDAIIVTLRIDEKRGDKIEFKKTRFSPGFFEEIMRPMVLIPLALALLLLFFLFGPLASFLRAYVRTLREKGGTEVTVDSKFEGGPEGEGGEGGPGKGGALSPAELEKLEEEKKKYRPFQYIDEENLKRLIYLIRRENPITIALIISYLKPEFVREILMSLPPETQAQVAVEMATIRQMTQAQVMEIDNNIKEKIDFLVGGLDHLLKVLDEVDKNTRDNILAYLENEKPELYEKVRKFILTFNDIANFPDQAVQIILREIKIENLARALRQAPPEVLNKFFANMTANAAALLKEEMEYGRPMTPEQIEEERRQIIEIIKRLENENKIFIREKPKSTLLEGSEEISEPAADQTSEATLGQYKQAGIDFYNNGSYSEAIPYLEYVCQINPQDAEAWQYLGNSYYSLGQMPSALKAFEEALNLNPQNSELQSLIENLKSQVQ